MIIRNMLKHGNGTCIMYVNQFKIKRKLKLKLKLKEN